MDRTRNVAVPFCVRSSTYLGFVLTLQWLCRTCESLRRDISVAQSYRIVPDTASRTKTACIRKLVRTGPIHHKADKCNLSNFASRCKRNYCEMAFSGYATLCRAEDMYQTGQILQSELIMLVVQSKWKSITWLGKITFPQVRCWDNKYGSGRCPDQTTKRPKVICSLLLVYTKCKTSPLSGNNNGTEPRSHLNLEIWAFIN